MEQWTNTHKQEHNDLIISWTPLLKINHILLMAQQYNYKI